MMTRKWSTIRFFLNYHVSANVYRSVFTIILKNRNLTAIPFILIPKYSHSNATLPYSTSFPGLLSCTLRKTLESRLQLTHISCIGIHLILQKSYRFSILLLVFKLALLASFLCSKIKRIFYLERGNKG